MTTSRFKRFVVRSLAALVCAAPAHAQTLTERGFLDGTVFLFPQQTLTDRTRVVGDFLARDEVFLKPAPWVQFAGAVDVRANTHDQVEDDWRIDLGDRTTRRPRLSLRRAAATLRAKAVTLDVGKQFIRWGKTDIVTPTDRFAPRDFVNVIDNEFLAVTGVRGTVAAGDDTIEAVWVPRFTPSRLPLLNQRWTPIPVPALPDPQLPDGAQSGLRWSHVGAGFEYALAFFDGFNHLPNIERAGLAYPQMRMYGGDVAMPTTWCTVKAESAYFTSSSPTTDEYVMYVVQLERQTGEWLIVGGFAGEIVTDRRALLTFAPDRGLTKSFVGRASYTIDVNRSLAIETAVRATGDGEYAKFEYSRAYGQHVRATLSAVAIAGHSDDFLGQYHQNSHATLTLRYSF
ncbi:MAG TPA: hypothetical protein VFA59_03640 [Vicinamibacterales bacterium]|nr:hypothetical protein [Vicinamibacterales bacterium]